MELKLFAQDVLKSAQQTINHEMREPQSEIHKMVSHVTDSLIKKIIDVSVAFLSVFFFLAGLVAALNSWFEVPIWISAWSLAAIGAVIFFATFKKTVKKPN